VHEVRMHASSIREPTMSGLPATTDVKSSLYSLRPLAEECLRPKSYDVRHLDSLCFGSDECWIRADLRANQHLVFVVRLMIEFDTQVIAFKRCGITDLSNLQVRTQNACIHNQP